MRGPPDARLLNADSVCLCPQPFERYNQLFDVAALVPGGPLSEDDPADGAERPPEAAKTGLEEAPRKGVPEGVPVGGEPPAAGGADLQTGPGAAEELRRRAVRAEERLAEVLAAYRQVKTENEGYRERITRNLERRFDQRRERLLLKFMEILDNLDRALEAAEQSYAGNPLIQGLILVRTQLLQTLQEEGLERIPVLGLAYDPNFSEAVGTYPVDDPDQHHVVVKELLRGYRLNGRIARASRVMVGDYHGERREGAPAAAAREEALIGADEVLAPAGREPKEGAEDTTLEEIVARAEQEEAIHRQAAEPAETEDPAGSGGTREEAAPTDEDDLAREAREALDPLYRAKRED
jgi:molecular chaperone GrpE